MNTEAAVERRWADDFRSLAGQLPGHGSAWVRGLRDGALAAFLEKGFPSRREEDWKYTNLRPLLRRRFLPLVAPADEQPLIRRFLLAGEETLRLVFVDGRLMPHLSNACCLPEGLTLTSLAAQLDKDPDLLRPWLDRVLPEERHAFELLNTAFMTDGAFIHVQGGVEIDTPIELLFVNTGGAGEAGAAWWRNLIVAEPGSRVSIIETHAGEGDAPRLDGAITEVVASESAAISHHRVVEAPAAAWHLGGVHVQLGPRARFDGFNFNLSGQVARTDLRVSLDGEAAECHLHGLVLGDGEAHADNEVVVEHRAPRTTSRQRYKAVLDGESRSAFAGRVVVHGEAQKADAEQANNNILLSDRAEADSKPQLEIYADDVKCSHGSTVGQLDADQLFYLRSRGLDAETARDLLIFAFASDVISAVALKPLRRRIEQYLSDQVLHIENLHELPGGSR